MVTVKLCAIVELEIELSGFPSTIDSQDIERVVDGELDTINGVLVDLVEWHEVERE